MTHGHGLEGSIRSVRKWHEVVEEVEHTLAAPDVIPHVCGAKAVGVRRIPGTVVVSTIEGEKGSASTSKLGGHKCEVGVEGEVRNAPTKREERKEFGSCSFLFPQMQVPKDERGQFACVRWRPHFIDYLFVAFTQSSTFGPTDAPLLARWAKVLTMIQVFISFSIVVLLISRAVGAL